jgi:pantoate--beta-alanine ligase
MITATTISEVRSFIAKQRQQNKKIGFIPTMGALHDGHLSLVHMSSKNNDACIMSIFVNPTQFGPGEDYSKYPRPIDEDKKVAEKAGIDLLFLPDSKTMYPSPENTIFVEETYLSQHLCGKFRPGHFRGVCTIVSKLLNIVTPDHMYLGEKDAQQLRILQEMVKQLNIPVETIGGPTFREENGVAMSSRNKYLSEQNKNKASVIYKALSVAKQLFNAGEKNAKALIQATYKILEQEPSFRIQYLELVQWSDLHKIETVSDKSLLAIAGYMGEIRLIDNVMLNP